MTLQPDGRSVLQGRDMRGLKCGRWATVTRGREPHLPGNLETRLGQEVLTLYHNTSLPLLSFLVGYMSLVQEPMVHMCAHTWPHGHAHGEHSLSVQWASLHP